MVDEINTGSGQVSAFRKQQADATRPAPSRLQPERSDAAPRAERPERPEREDAVRLSVPKEVLDIFNANTQAAGELAPTVADLQRAASSGRLPGPGASVNIFI